MKILLGVTGLSLDGGIATVARCLDRFLRDESRTGQVRRYDRLSLLDDSPQGSPDNGREWLARGRQWQFFLQANYLIRHQRYDLVLLDHIGLARALAWAPGVRYSVFCHGLELANLRAGSPWRRAAERAHRLIANSETTARILAELMPDARDRIRHVGLCVDPGRAEAWSALASSSTPDRGPTALIVGRLQKAQPGKGHETLIDCWPEVLRSVPNAKLWIVGDGDKRDALETRARHLGSAVEFFGRVSDKELFYLFQKSGVFAMPSRQEGFGLVYAEAMWNGLPCIASDADAGREVVRHGITGLIVPYGDVDATSRAVIHLISEPNLWSQRCTKEAHARFSYGNFFRELHAALEI